MDFELTPEQEAIRDTVCRFARAELEPVAASLDRDGDRAMFLGNLRKRAALGMMGLTISEELGGVGAGTVAFSVALTEIARACASTAVTVSVNNLVCEVRAAVGS